MIFTLPGIYDCLGAKIAESLGFDALYLSGGALSLAALGRPDSGYLNLTDLRMVLERVYQLLIFLLLLILIIHLVMLCMLQILLKP